MRQDTVKVGEEYMRLDTDFRLYGHQNTNFWLYGLRKYGHFRIYGHFLSGPDVDHISGSECTLRTTEPIGYSDTV